MYIKSFDMMIVYACPAVIFIWDLDTLILLMLPTLACWFFFVCVYHAYHAMHIPIVLT